jgi:hypothetical protein
MESQNPFEGVTGHGLSHSQSINHALAAISFAEIRLLADEQKVLTQ